MTDEGWLPREQAWRHGPKPQISFVGWDAVRVFAICRMLYSKLGIISLPFNLQVIKVRY